MDIDHKPSSVMYDFTTADLSSERTQCTLSITDIRVQLIGYDVTFDLLSRKISVVGRTTCIKIRRIPSKLNYIYDLLHVWNIIQR